MPQRYEIENNNKYVDRFVVDDKFVAISSIPIMLIAVLRDDCIAKLCGCSGRDN